MQGMKPYGHPPEEQGKKQLLTEAKNSHREEGEPERMASQPTA